MVLDIIERGKLVKTIKQILPNEVSRIQLDIKDGRVIVVTLEQTLQKFQMKDNNQQIDDQFENQVLRIYSITDIFF